MRKDASTVLLVERDPTLRELNELILSEAGYSVAMVPLNVDPVAYAAQTHPSVIIVSIAPTESETWAIIDRLRADPKTANIPVVVITTYERTAVEAHAAPNVPETVAAPYDIEALTRAVSKAMGHPPPAAVLPETRRSPPPSVARAGDVLTKMSRSIILHAIEQVRQEEPFRSRFAELTPAIIDELPIIIGAVVDGLRRNLTPEQVISVPEIQRAIRQHSDVRRGQGIPIAAVILEYQTLRGQMLQMIEMHSDQEHLTARDAFEIIRPLDAFMDRIIRLAVEYYVAPPKS